LPNQQFLLKPGDSAFCRYYSDIRLIEREKTIADFPAPVDLLQ
jgi:hypothetical protein